MIVELGIPAGFYPVAEDWEQMAAEDRVQDYAIESNDKITAYLRDLEPGAQLTLSYRLWARVPGSVRVPPSRIYQSVAPAAGTEAGSGQLLVTQ